jgi:cytochrome c peroxidase
MVVRASAIPLRWPTWVTTHAFFRDGGVPTLEQQVIAPIHDVVEMDHDIQVAAAMLRDVEPYEPFESCWPTAAPWMPGCSRVRSGQLRAHADQWLEHAGIAWMQGEAERINGLRSAGLAALQQCEALNCMECHSGFDFSDHDFHNVGQYLDYGRSRA